MQFSSLPDLHRTVCRQLGPRTALRYKRDGLYHSIDWDDYRWQCDSAAAGLINLGVEAGDRVAILSENRIEWFVVDHAILSCGAIDVPLHAPLAAKQVEFQIGHSESRGVVVSNQQQADKVFEVLDGLPQLEFLVSFESIEVPETALRIMTWDGLKQRGQMAGQEAVRGREQALTHDDIATIIYTSGTTGNPKGVMLTHGNLLDNAESTLVNSRIGHDDILLSWLPYSHIYARTVDHYLTTMAGAVVAMAQSIDTLVDNLAEIQPTWLTSVPRFYEKLWTAVESQSADERTDSLHKIFGPRLRQLCSGGAPLPQHVCEGFHAAGLMLLEGYGLTESSPVICFNSIENYRIGSVGQALHGVEVKIADDGEILTRGPHVMTGYWKNPEATAETIVDGWLLTGDVGELDDDGFLTITDRKKDLIVTSAGKNIAPSEIERLLISDEYIDQAVVFGDGRRFISALLVPNFESLSSENLGEWDDSGNFIQKQNVIDLYTTRIDNLMQSVSQPERVKKFLLLARAFEQAADELTATLKVRRRHIITKYEAELTALYDEV